VDVTRPPPLLRQRTRTFYNVADAQGPGCSAVDLLPSLERELRHRGPAAARWLWFWLSCLEWEPVLTLRARQRFFRLPREQRGAALQRWASSRIPARARAFRELEAALARGAREALQPQSSDGA
jgi:hypothetical protein